MASLITEHAGVTMHPSMPLEDARAICDRLGVVYEAGWGAGKLMAEVFEATAEASLDRADVRARPPARDLPAGPRAPRRSLR